MSIVHDHFVLVWSWRNFNPTTSIVWSKRGSYPPYDSGQVISIRFSSCRSQTETNISYKICYLSVEQKYHTSNKQKSPSPSVHFPTRVWFFYPDFYVKNQQTHSIVG